MKIRIDTGLVARMLCVAVAAVAVIQYEESARWTYHDSFAPGAITTELVLQRSASAGIRYVENEGTNRSRGEAAPARTPATAALRIRLLPPPGIAAFGTAGPCAPQSPGSRMMAVRLKQHTCHQSSDNDPHDPHFLKS